MKSAISNQQSTFDSMSPKVPDKPALEGLEQKWMARWDADAVYRFDRTRTRPEVFSIDTPDKNLHFSGRGCRDLRDGDAHS